MDGGELATDGAVVDDLLDGCPQFLHALKVLVLECAFKCILALVAPSGATSAVFQNLGEYIGRDAKSGQQCAILPQAVLLSGLCIKYISKHLKVRSGWLSVCL